MATRHPAESVTSLRHTGYTRTSAARPEIFVKLGPSTDGMAPFCWSQLGPTTADVTIQAPVPAEPVVEPAQPAQSEKSGEPVQGGHKKAPDKASGGHLRKTPASPAVDGSASASSEDEVEADNDSSADSDEPDTSASSTTTAPVTPVADRATTGTTTTGTTAGTDVTTTSTSTSTGSVAPTAQPTFRQGPRVYVHKGHPECFDFDWETMPPLKKDKK